MVRRQAWKPKDSERLKALAEQGLPVSQIAKAMGRPVSTVHRRVNLVLNGNDEEDTARTASFLTWIEQGVTNGWVAELAKLERGEN